MKIKNEEVSIKVGNKEHKFTNMILNNYLDLFADNFIEFKDKGLPYCLISFTKTNYNIDEDSTSMQYDLILQLNLDEETEILTERSVINKYCYTQEQAGGATIQDFVGSTVKSIGFANYNYDINDYEIYAYLDVTRYNIIIQENQPFVVSRTDKIESDMQFWASSNLIKGPIHLTKRGMLNVLGYDYNRIIPKLYSIGLGVLPYTLNKEYLAEELTIQKTGLGTIEINNQIETGYTKDLFFSNDLYMNDSLVLKKPNYPFLIYKFKLYEETFPNPEEAAVYVDTNKYYVQYQEIKKYGDINLKIKYERG